eukprot:768539-Hanusia_phi.AAC.7
MLPSTSACRSAVDPVEVPLEGYEGCERELRVLLGQPATGSKGRLATLASPKRTWRISPRNPLTSSTCGRCFISLGRRTPLTTIPATSVRYSWSP